MRVPQRGRAILRRLSAHDSAHDSARAFRPGDFLLTSSDGGLARLQGWASGGALNHAAVIIDPLGSVVEANPTFLRDARPFRLATIAEYLQAGKPCWIGYVELREGTRQDVAGYAEHLLRAGGSSNFSGRLWLTLHTLFGIAPRAWLRRVPWLGGLHRFLDDHALVLREEHCFSSGELVARALERGGFIWERDPAYVTPADLFASFHHLDAILEPVQLTERRKAGMRRAPSAGAQGGAPIASFGQRGVRGANALHEELEEVEAPPVGIQALARVGVFMAAGLAVIGLVEEGIKLLTRDL
jgi:hypothetical protein